METVIVGNYLKKYNMQFYKEQKGSGLMETLMAIAIIGAIMPFAYNSAMDITHKVSDAAESKRVIAWQDPVMVYVRKNQADWPSNAQVEFDKKEIDNIGTGDNRLLEPYAGFIEKREVSGGTSINAYLAFKPVGIKKSRVANIAQNLGMDAAIVQPGGEAVSSSGWSISSELFTDGDLVFRISDILGEDDAYKYLHRTYLDDAELNTMRRDLDMAKHNIFDVIKITAQTINSTNAETWFVDAQQIKTNEVFFPKGMSIDGSKTEFESINVNGDVSGFRKITADKLKNISTMPGATWATKGDIVADSVNINGPVHVQHDMVIRSESARTITGFAGVRAQSVSTPFLSADNIIFQNGFGITISSDLLYSNTSEPIKIGSWSFPSAAGPYFSELFLKRASDKEFGTALAAPNNQSFLPIITSGWKN